MDEITEVSSETEMAESITPSTDMNAEANQENGFSDFGFCDELMQGITEAGFTEPTPIQAQAIPLILQGRDVIGQALTGTGKTAAFGLPILNALKEGTGLRLLVLTPTRELAAQVSTELHRFSRFMNLRTAAFTGGQSYSMQEKLLKKGIDALVATPGRLMDLMDSGYFVDVNPSYIVVDEADEMLDMGFIEDIRKIFAAFSGPRQTMLFSATMPKPVVELAEEILKEPVELTIDVKETANNNIQQVFYVIEERERNEAVIRLIDSLDVEKAMIFCGTKEETDAMNILLGGRGYNVNCLHGDMDQAQRTRVMNAFRRSEIDILVATDVAARGLDVDDVTHVFNFHLPFDARGYVHRIGRTGRAGKSGMAITLVTPREMRKFDFMKKSVGAQVENRLIPSRTQVLTIRLKKLFQDLQKENLEMEMMNQVQSLSVNQDVMVLLTKLCTHLLNGGADQGAEHIGIAGERLQEILEGKGSRRSREERGGRGERGKRGGHGERGEHRFNRRTRREPAPPQEEFESIMSAEATPAPVPDTAKKRSRGGRKGDAEKIAFADEGLSEIFAPREQKEQWMPGKPNKPRKKSEIRKAGERGGREYQPSGKRKGKWPEKWGDSRSQKRGENSHGSHKEFHKGRSRKK